MSDNVPSNISPDDLASILHALPQSHTDIPAILGVMVPIIAIVMGLGLGMLVLWLDFRKKREMFQLHHAERMAAIDKGIELPPLPPEFFGDFKRRERGPTFYFRRGILWLLIGGAVTIAMRGEGQMHNWWGLVPVAIGVAYLLSDLVERRRAPGAPPPTTPPSG
jgi:hypothetical protein